MDAEPARSTVDFDGSCPLCRAEIGYYRRKDHSGALCFVDVSDPHALVPDGLSQRRAMERFHVRAGDGALLSGAAAFVKYGRDCRVGAGRRALRRFLERWRYLSSAIGSSCRHGRRWP